MDFIHQVFLVKVQKRSFDWTMPHQPIFKRGESRGTLDLGACVQCWR
jgi:hypothetical protein